jgi:hypothetical protein
MAVTSPIAPHRPNASPASPASPASKTWAAATGAPRCDQQNKIRGAEGGISTGKVLTALPGSYKGLTPITLTYQWTRDGTNIASATATTYTLVAADVGHTISCNETATNSQGAVTHGSFMPVS